MKIDELQPGDLLLWRIYLKKSGFRKFISKIIGLFQIPSNQGGTYKKTYSHIAIVDYDINYLLESTWPRAIRRPITIPKLPHKLEVYRVKRASEQVAAYGNYRYEVALDWCYERLGTRYDIFQLISFGLIDSKNKEICSTYIGVAYRHAGIILSIKGKEDNLQSPNEIAYNEVELKFKGELDMITDEIKQAELLQ